MKRWLEFLLAISAVVPLSSGCSDRLSLGDFPGGGGGGGGGEEPPPPPAPLVSSTPLGLTSAVGGLGSIRVDWRPPSALAEPLSLVLFLTAPEDTPWYPTPLPLDEESTHHVIDGLPDGLRFKVRLGVLPEGSELHVPVGPELTVRTGAPIYVDITANPDVADGTTPETAYNDLILGVLMAFTFGGGNVWVAEGEFGNMSLPLFSNVDVYGGFGPGFHLEGRDSTAHPTRLVGLPNLAVATLTNGEALSILDGFHLDGAGAAAIGVEIEDSPFEGRELHATHCKRGFKLRRGSFSDPVSVSLTSCSGRLNELEGLSGEGPIDLRLDGCRFSDNNQEGVDLGSWTAPDGEIMRLTVRDCAFLRNVTEGLDIDMNAPLTGGATGGQFKIRVDSSTFQENGAAGLLIDVDYEAYPAWSSEIVVRGCYSRANLGSGVHLDMDSNSVAFVHRLGSHANGEHGLYVSSETAPGTVTVSSSAFLANQGAGIRSELGNVGVLASHCVLLGNRGAGFESLLAPGSAVSSAALIQDSPWTGMTNHHSVDQVAADPAPFVRTPRFVTEILGFEGEQVMLSATPPASAGLLAEISDDGVMRSVLAQSGSSLSLDPPPAGIALPEVITLFDTDESVDEDYRLSHASAFLGAGMPPIVGGLTDAGVHGSPLGGQPGGEEILREPLFFFADSSPSWVLPIDAQAEIQLRFEGDTPDPAGAPLFVQVVRPDMIPVVVIAWVEDGALHITPPTAGWESGFLIELHDGLTSESGLKLAAPVAIPLSVK